MLSRRATKYQLLFRHVFHCKHVERRLCRRGRRTRRPARRRRRRRARARRSLGRAYVLSQRMLHFLQNFTYYLMCEVVEPNWHAFETALRDAQSVDELIDAHALSRRVHEGGDVVLAQDPSQAQRIKNVCLKFCGLSETLSSRCPVAAACENLRAGRLMAGGEDTGGRSARARGARRRGTGGAGHLTRRGDKYASGWRAGGRLDAQLRELLEALNAARTEPNLAACAPGWTSTSSTRSDRAASTPDERAGERTNERNKCSTVK